MIKLPSQLPFPFTEATVTDEAVARGSQQSANTTPTSAAATATSDDSEEPT